MAGKIPAEFIQDLLSRVDLVDVIEARLPLKRSGSNFLALCPFHSEKTPSFNISPEKQFYHCFGCGAHGNAIDFLIEYDRLGFVEAVESLADRVGLSVPAIRASEKDNRQNELFNRLFEIQERAARFFQDQLKTHPSASQAVEYLKRRGVTGALAQRYRLGYAPPAWRNLPSDWPATLLEEAGLTIRKDERSYNRFRNRVMFPIRDRRGKIVGFGGRILLGDETPKYLNSPETPVFKKHKEVYGLYELLKSPGKPENIIVVEGYMDVIALAQYGFSNTVATLGTAISAQHVELLFRFSNELVFCFDGDRAGQEAAWKALEASLPVLREGRSIKFLTLPEGQDPDSLIRTEGAEGFRGRLEKAQPFSRYFLKQLTVRLGFVTVATAEQRSAVLSTAKPLLEKLPSGSFREAIEQELANLAGQPQAGHTGSFKMPAGSRENTVAHSGNRSVPSLLRTFLSLLLEKPGLAALIPLETRKRLESNEKAGILIGKILALLDDQPRLTLGGLREHFRDMPEESWIARLSDRKAYLISGDETATCLQAVKAIDESAESVFREILSRLDRQMRLERLEMLINKSAVENLTTEESQEMRKLTSWELS